MAECRAAQANKWTIRVCIRKNSGHKWFNFSSIVFMFFLKSRSPSINFLPPVFWYFLDVLLNFFSHDLKRDDASFAVQCDAVLWLTKSAIIWKPIVFDVFNPATTKGIPFVDCPVISWKFEPGGISSHSKIAYRWAKVVFLDLPLFRSNGMAVNELVMFEIEAIFDFFEFQNLITQPRSIKKSKKIEIFFNQGFF